MSRPWRVLVCGSTFGQFALAAVHASPDMEAAALLARGSDRSVRVAQRAGIPLIVRAADVGEIGHLDAAYVAVRSGSMGGPGTELARELLARGVAVVQEHPVHHDELVSCLRAAGASGAAYRVGDLYPQLPAARRFTGAAATLRGLRPVRYATGAASVQVLLPLLHILGNALGGLRPWRLDAHDAGGGWRVLTGEIAGVPTVLRVHAEIDPDAPDDHLVLPHQVTVGTDAGDLGLTDVHGPVTWSPRLHVPDAVKEHLDVDGPGTGHLAEPPVVVLGPAPPSYRELMATAWPAAIGRDLLALRAGPDARHGQYLLSLTRLWHDATEAVGYPAPRPGQHHRPLSASLLATGISP